MSEASESEYAASKQFQLIRQHALWVLVCFFLAISFFAANNLSQKVQDRYDASVIRTWTESSIQANVLIHELQKERGLSSGYLASGGTKFGERLAQQREKTSQAILQLASQIQDVEEEYSVLAQQILSAMPDEEGLNQRRKFIIDLGLSQEAAVDYYSRLINGLFEQLLISMNIGKSGWIYRQQLSFVFFLQTKEMLGQERALVTAMLSARDFGPLRMNEFHRIKALENAREEKFFQLSDPETLRDYAVLSEQPFVRQAERIRRLIVAYGASAQDVEVNFPEAQVWFELASQRIDAMSEFEEKLASALIQGARDLEKQAWRDLWVNAITVMISFVLAVVLLAQIRRGERVAKDNLHLSSVVFNASMESVVITDGSGKILEVNDAFTRITGYSREEAVGQTPRLWQSARHDRFFYETLWQTLLKTGHWESEVWNRRKDGRVYPAFLSIVSVPDADGGVRYLIGSAVDLSNHKETEALLEQVRTRDPLTQLPNREAWMAAMDTVLSDFGNTQREGKSFAVITLGIDRFKRINDSIHHVVGDKVLAVVAQRIQSTLPPRAMAARLDGDRFSVLLFEGADIQSVAAYCEQLVSAFMPVVEIEKLSFALSLSMGVAMCPGDGTSVRELRKNSEAAMYRAKEESPGSYVFYSEEMNAQSASLLRMERMLRQALEKEEFSLVYQPQLSAVDGRLMGVEALIRWQSPELGMVSPVQFIPIAEESGLINPIGEWVMRRACEEMQALRLETGVDLTLAVNLSAPQFRRADLMVSVQLILDATKFPRGLLELEITEGLLMVDPMGTTLILDGLRQMGMRVALDDFGTGYSSLSYLKNFPIDRLKIDRAFVMDLPDSEPDKAISRAVIALGRNLGMEVLAEGVETESQAAYLKAEGCQVFQGYLYAKPMPATQLLAEMRADKYKV